VELRTEQLAAQLARGLTPCYLVSGDEPLQVQEACDAVRAAAGANGFSERVVLFADQHFDWNSLLHHAHSPSLFAARKLIELRMAGKPSAAGARTLENYARNPQPDNLLLLAAARLDAAERRARWYRALAASGVAVQVWPVTSSELAKWIERRARSQEVRLTPNAVSALAERVEGNLLACAQELSKLRLLYGSETVDAAAVLATVADSARFDVFDLVDGALSNDRPRTLRVLRGLREEGVEPTLVLWALVRELRTVATLARAVAQGEKIEQILAKRRTPPRRKGALRRALERAPEARWLALLASAGLADRVLKGTLVGEPWAALQRLALGMCGVLSLVPDRYNEPAATLSGESYGRTT
jgi:DNA polymerase-3 subunit delta